MQGQDVLFSSASVEWGTPQYIFRPLHEEFGFTLDVCATPVNAKCVRWFGLQPDGTFVDGLKQDWTNDVCWMNPPYNRYVKDWVRKAYESACDGATVVCLVPARTDTRWWNDYAVYAHEIRFVVGRIRFELDGKYNSATFPSAVLVYRGVPNNEPYRCVKQWLT